MDINNIFVYSNRNEQSVSVASSIKASLEKAGFIVKESFDNTCDLMVCVGGDGGLLRSLRTYDFPSIPIVGVNTGHLGFFQEYQANNPELIAKIIKDGTFSLQHHRLLKAEVVSEQGSEVFYALNDMLLRRAGTSALHINLSIGDSAIEKFSGDGIVISSPAGSTGYNYSLGGSILDPRVAALQVTPMAPINSNAFRSLTSSLILPPDIGVKLSPSDRFYGRVSVVADGEAHTYSSFKSLVVTLSPKEIMLARSVEYNFWHKVKDKFI